MKPRSVPKMTTNEEAEAFLDHDLSDLDFTAFQPLPRESEPKTARVGMRLPAPLMEAAKARAAERGIPLPAPDPRGDRARGARVSLHELEH